MAKKQAFITLKDHKENFANKPTCRLINPTKSEIGHISKQILEKINKAITKQNEINLWRNTSEVVNWFKNIQNKSTSHFICFDIVEFYPSITQQTLEKALNYASQFAEITKEEREIIFHSKKSLLYNDNTPWNKKTSQEFDITMGSFDGAEACELIGCFILAKLNKKYGKSIGLYRDDGLAVLNESPQKIEKIKKDICATFKEYDLKITIEANKKIVNFLDVTFDLNIDCFKPYNKPNNIPQYVHCNSNHPQNIIKNLPIGINKRLSEISANEKVFTEATPIYQKALQESGYKHQLKYIPTPHNSNKKRNRSRNIIWYNPPYDLNVETNIGKEFFKILHGSFHEKHCLHKIFNKNNVKLSYSCMPNMKNIIDSKNKQKNVKQNTENNETNNSKKCNCRNKKDCPLKGQCLEKSIIYQAKVTTENKTETYVGLTETEFKTRYNNHKATFKTPNKKNTTELSKHIWTLKESNTKFEIQWSILSKASAYSNTSKRCNLCTCEKYFIIFQPGSASLNKRSELINTCRHKRKFLLAQT
jgi:hypothetical protein